MIRLVIGNVYSKIVGHLPDEVNDEIYNALAYTINNKVFILKNIKIAKDKDEAIMRGKNPGHQKYFHKQKEEWDGVVRLYYRDKGQSFYTGLLSNVRDILNKHNIKFDKLDKRVVPDQNMPNLKFTPPKGYEERQYQQFSIDRGYKFTRGVYSVATGGGKTMLVTELISKIKTYPFIFYVLTIDLMIQAHSVLSECLNEPIGMIGGGKFDIQKITVCTIQTSVLALNAKNKKFNVSDYKFDDEDKWDEPIIDDISKKERLVKLIKEAKGIFLDECHHVASRTAKEVMAASHDAYWRFGGSATPHRDSGDGIMIQAMFGSKIVEISASYLIKHDFLVKPNIFSVVVDGTSKYHSYHKVYSDIISKNAEFHRNVAMHANHLLSRDLSVLILVRDYAHGDFLKKLIPGSVFVTSRMKPKKREESIQRLRDGNLKCMIATSLADEGLDVPTLDSAILAGGGKSSTRLSQRIGRTLRKDKNREKDKSIVIIYNHHKAKFLKSHSERIMKLLKEESEFNIINCNGNEYLASDVDGILGFGTGSKNLFDW